MASGIVSYTRTNGIVSGLDINNRVLQTYEAVPMVSNGSSYTGAVSGITYGSGSTGVATIDTAGALALGWTWHETPTGGPALLATDSQGNVTKLADNGTQHIPIPYILAQSAVPVGIVGGDGAAVGLNWTNTTGAFAIAGVGGPFYTTYSNGIWLRIPAGGFGGGQPASTGFYWCVMSSTTVGQCYTTTWNGTYPIPNPGTTGLIGTTTVVGFMTGLTTASNAVALTIPGGSLGLNGRLSVQILGSFNSTGTAGNKTINASIAGTVFGGYTFTTQTASRVVMDLYAQNSYTSQIGTNFLSYGGQVTMDFMRRTYNLAADQTLAIPIQTSTAATDYNILEAFTVIIYPG